MDVLSINSLIKDYGSIMALNGMSLTVPEGSVFGILGPNVSGKTTLPGITLDILKARSGKVLFNGQVELATT